jgi:DNA primase
MINQEHIKELKHRIRIEYFLNSRGFSPVSQSGKCYKYISPLRQEKTASFSVDTERNTFFDFGNPDKKTTSIIDLVMLMDKVSFPDACKILEDFDGKEKIEFEGGNFSFLTVNTLNDRDPQRNEVTAVKDLQHPALIRYMEKRKITLKTAFSYLKEIHYKNAKGQFFGVGYENDSGGFVVRSDIMKKPINLGHTGIKTFAVDGSRSVSIFEGLFDFLSAIEYYKNSPRCTAIVLNSVSNLSKAMPQLKGATTIYSYLDNDDAGRKATQKMRDAGLNVIDQSTIYEEYKDFNEYINKQ